METQASPTATVIVQGMLIRAADNRWEEQRHAMATHMQTRQYTASNNKKCYDPKVVEFMVCYFN